MFLGNKPYGISTHQVDPHKPGYIEWLSHHLQKKVYPCHRLDKTTTGALLATADRDLCAQASQLFAENKVQKKYLLITDREPAQKEWTIESEIEKQGSHWISKIKYGGSARTTFCHLKSQGKYHLVEAQPLSGKTHQIRLHARDAKIPLLGDTLYGGSPYPLLFLHCSELLIPDLKIHHTASPPTVYSHLELLKYSLLMQWLMSVDRRQRLYPELLKDQQCLRLIHDEGTPLRLDLLGEVAHAGWWSDAPPSEEALQQLEMLLKQLSIPHWSLQNFGKNKDNKFIIDRAPEKWTARENSLTYQLQKDVGNAPGLFLDQRNHRHWLMQNAKGKKVLNLFSYTGGFSLCAARGSASEIVTVDLSNKYKKWAEQNFQLNHFQSEKFKFYAMDTFEYLKYAHKKNLQFDIIVCDPPSFSRTPKGERFQIEKQFPELIDGMLKVLAEEGLILFSTNFEAWDLEQWTLKLKQSKYSQSIEITENISWQWDFETSPLKTHMKSFHIQKKLLPGVSKRNTQSKNQLSKR